MKNIIPILFLIHFQVSAQNLAPIEPISEEYGFFSQHSPESNSDKSELDAISFPNEGPGKMFLDWAARYLSNQEINGLKSLIDFPANSSDQTRAELDYLLDWQEKRTSADKRRVNEIARVGYWPPEDRLSADGRNVEALFWECDEVMGDCEIENYPATKNLLAGITRDMRIVEFVLKYHFLRARPYQLEPKLEPMSRMRSPSFASGHTLWAYIHAFTFASLIPEKREAFLEVANEVGVSREIMGIHYPSDEEAARIVAYRMLELMWEKEEFKRDWKLAKDEWK